MSQLTDLPVRALLDALAARTPVPGGGAAAALAGAMGASLLLMVSRLPRTRHGTDAERGVMARAEAALLPAAAALTDLVDADARAYTAVLAAMRLPKAGDRERDARRAAIDAAMADATSVLLDTMRACGSALDQAPAVAAAVNANAAADLRVGVELLWTALRGCAVSVDANLPALSGDAVRSQAASARHGIEAAARDAVERARHAEAADAPTDTPST